MVSRRTLLGAALASLAPSPGGKYPIQRTWRIMPFGDSITAGQGTTDGGWRSRLRPLIRDPFVYVGTQLDDAGAHEGHGGWRTDNLEGIATATVSASAPDFVLLMAGTNDIHQHRTPDLDGLLQLVRAAAPTATVVLGQIPYVLTWDDQQRAAADAYNTHIATLGGPWTRVKVVDMRGVEISADNVHPTAAGYQMMAERWLPTLPVHGLRQA